MIYWNCCGHSFTMSFAAVPTDFIVHAARAHGMTALNRRFVKTQGFKMSPLVTLASTVKAPRSVKLTRAAPTAKLLP